MMLKVKSILIAALLAASAFAATSAFAISSWTINGSNSGSTTVSGPTTATVFGVPVPCTASFTLTVTSGSAKVTGANFSGNSACTEISSVLPWTVSEPSAISGSSSVNLTISGIEVKISGQTCTGSASGTLSNANPNGSGSNTFTFSGSLGLCTVKSNPSVTGSGIGTQ
jgi:hypothetical protein